MVLQQQGEVYNLKSMEFVANICCLQIWLQVSDNLKKCREWTGKEKKLYNTK